ncbi:MAG: hypothetical protein U0R76_10710 [Candidatus Nanopelagicales bacterium]
MTEQEIIALIALAGVVLTALGGLIAALLTGKQRENEAVWAELREQIDDLREQVANNETRIQRLERRDRQWADYVHVLRRHITAQKPPPPPEWPAGLDQ